MKQLINANTIASQSQVSRRYAYDLMRRFAADGGKLYKLDTGRKMLLRVEQGEFWQWFEKEVMRVA